MAPENWSSRRQEYAASEGHREDREERQGDCASGPYGRVAVPPLTGDHCHEDSMSNLSVSRITEEDARSVVSMRSQDEHDLGGIEMELSSVRIWGIGRGSKRRWTSLAPTESYEIGAGASSPEPKTCWIPKSVKAGRRSPPPRRGELLPAERAWTSYLLATRTS
jgi:hypothetical protein